MIQAKEKKGQVWHLMFRFIGLLACPVHLGQLSSVLLIFFVY